MQPPQEEDYNDDEDQRGGCGQMVESNEYKRKRIERHGVSFGQKIRYFLIKSRREWAPFQEGDN